MFNSWFTVIKLYIALLCLYWWSQNRIEAHNRAVYDNLIGSKNNYTSFTLVIAHPDDEVMFFAPTLLQLDAYMDRSVPFNVICLTEGDSKNLGKVRKRELRKSLQVLILNHKVNLRISNFTDGMMVNWEPFSVEIKLNSYIKDTRPLILTFDERGVSGHRNHIACAKAVRNLGYKTLYLKSGKNVLRKYSSFTIDLMRILFGYQLQGVFISTFPQYLHSFLSMYLSHKSQMVWYRWGWWVFSRFVYANEY